MNPLWETISDGNIFNSSGAGGSTDFVPIWTELLIDWGARLLC
jgi:hypothetical protein